MITSKLVNILFQNVSLYTLKHGNCLVTLGIQRISGKLRHNGTTISNNVTYVSH